MNKRLKKILIGMLILLGAVAGGFFLYVADYYRADDTALVILENNPSIRSHDDHLVLSTASPGDTGLIFYPGGKVEHLAYLPLLDKITKTSGITSILVKMPFHLAVFDVNAADRIIEQYPTITTWYIGGHSLGGAMASGYAERNPDKVKGLILLGAYIYGDYPAKDALTIYGTFNTAVAEKIGYTENVVAIEGGNHAQFGNYGSQKGDPDATISADDQQDQAIEAIREFLARKRQSSQLREIA